MFDVAAGQLVPGWRLKCGNRTDLPKKARVHAYQHLGTDLRNTGTAAGYVHGEVYACTRCGTDKFRAGRGPKMQAVEKFLGISYGIKIETGGK